MTEPAIPHHCSACGEVHGASPRTSPEVEIARIQAERDIRVAELSRGEFQKTELEAETEIAVAEIEAAADVEEAIVKAEVLDDILTPEPEPEPVVIVENEAEAESAEPDDAPPEIETAPPAPKRSNAWW